MTLAGGQGAAVLVTAKGGANFMFVQDGTAGTADDSIIGLSTLSGAAMPVATAAGFTFSGQS